MKTNRLTILRQIKPYLRPVRWSVIVLILTGLLTVPIALLSPKFFQILVDEVMTQKMIDRFWLVVGGLLLIYLLRFILDGSALVFGNRVLNGFTFRLRADILQKYQKAPYSFMEKQELGDLKMRLLDDVDCLGNFIREQVAEYYSSILIAAAAVLASVFISPMMTLICLLVIPIVFLINYLIARGANKANEAVRTVQEQYATSTYNALLSWQEIKAQGAEETFISRYRHFRSVLAKLGLRAIRYWGYTEVFNDLKVNYLTKVMVYIIGAFFVIDQKITVGSMIMFAEYFALLFSALDSVNTKRAGLRQNMPYYRRVFDTLSFPKEEPRPALSEEKLGGLSVSGLSFGYREGQEVLRDISFTVRSGDYTAIIGKTGCGKTTLIKLLLGLYEPAKGEISYGPCALRQANRRSLYHKIGVVMQDHYLFDASIRENLLLYKRDATEDELIEACKKACLSPFIRAQEQGLDTMIGERGVRLSGGQKKRLAIAAALLKQPSLLLLDEASGPLDRETEEIIDRSIRNYGEETTVIVVSHKPSAILRAEQVFLIENGSIRPAEAKKLPIKNTLGQASEKGANCL